MNILLNSLTLPLRPADSTPAAATGRWRPPTPHIGLKRLATPIDIPGPRADDGADATVHAPLAGHFCRSRPAGRATGI